jgi:hypothetical protein
MHSMTKTFEKSSIHFVIKTLSGKQYEINFKSDQAIGEFRKILSSTLGLAVHDINIKNITDENGNRLCTIFQDDPSELNLLDFIKNAANLKTENKDKLLLFNNLSVYVTLLFDPTHRRFHEKIPIEKYNYYDPNCKLVALLHKSNMQYNHQNTRAGLNFRKTLKTLLTEEKENPNKPSKDGLTAIGSALLFQSQGVIRQLLWYDADPRKDRHAWAQFNDVLRVFNKTDPLYKKLAIIDDHFKPPERPFQQPNTLIFLDMKFSDQRIKTTLMSGNQIIKLEMCESPTLTTVEFNHLFQLYRHYFEPSPTLKGTIEDFFSYEVKGNMKFVESIKLDNNKLAGMNLYEIIIDAKFPDTIFVHISCIFVQENLRGLGLTDPLVTSLPHAMPKLFETKNIVYVFQSISYGSARLVEGLAEYFPKFRTPYSSMIANTIIHHIQRDAVLTDKPMQSSSAIEVQVVKPPENKVIATKLPKSREIFFNQLRGINIASKGKKTPYEHIGVLFMVKVSKESQDKYLASAKLLGFDGERYLDSLAKHFANLIPDLKPYYNAKPILATSGIFSNTKPGMSNPMESSPQGVSGNHCHVPPRLV